VFSTIDTIVAIATPPGRGALGVIRVSGPDAHAIVRQLVRRQAPLQPRRATLCTLCSATDEPVDQVLLTYFPSPASYTGDDVVEISAHGSPVVLRTIVQQAVERGARLAEPGEFTLRAFLRGRIDLTQAEAVADLIDAVTPLQAQAAFDQLNGTLTEKIAAIDAVLFDLIARLEASVDFPEEGFHFVKPGELAVEIEAIANRTSALLRDARRGRIVREGLQIAIVGAPNVGKSSLFNALVGTSRAIVDESAGTTRDLVSETIDLHGVRVTLVDTAGLRTTDDRVELEGVARATRAARAADVVLVVCDRSMPFDDPAIATAADTAMNRLLVASKADLPACWDRPDAIAVSSQTGVGLERLRERIVEALGVDPAADRPEITNVRHIALVERAEQAIRHARAALDAGPSMSEEFLLADLQEARAAFEEVTGRRAPDDLLAHIFERFCVGK
jgi:tRNA modification GTPase